MTRPVILAGMLVGVCLAQHGGDWQGMPLEEDASENVSAEGLTGWSPFCAAESQRCWWWRPCCGSMQCESLLGGSGHVCVEKQPQCVAENGICGGPGQQTQQCCGDMQCKQLLGGSQMRCQSSPSQCVAGNGICGGPGQLTQPCCGDMQCKKLLSGQMRCGAAMSLGLASIASALDSQNVSDSESSVDASSDGEVVIGTSQCVAENSICGGPGQLTQPCCGDMQCKKLLSGSQMRCQSSPSQCVAENSICGGPGQLTQPCCGDMQCKKLLGGSQMRCQSSLSQCVAENGICGGPGQLTQQCCGDMQCKHSLGGGDMRCIL